MPEKGNFPNGHGNRGGNEGNKYGAGAKRKALRLKMLKSLGISEKDVAAILGWKPVFPVFDEAGKLKRKRPPTVDEWKWAMEFNAKYGLGPISSVELTGEDGGPVQVTGLDDALRRAYGDEPS